MCIQLGSYVRVINPTLKTFNKKGLVVRLDHDSNKYLVLFSDNTKIQCSEGALARLDYETLEAECLMVKHKDKDYLVTPKWNIVSLTTHRIMQWDKSNGDYLAIIAKYQSATLYQGH